MTETQTPAWPVLEIVEDGNYTIKVVADEEPLDPRREYDNFGTMVCWHPYYCLGDFQLRSPAGRGAVEKPFERDDFESLAALKRWLTLCKDAAVVLPLYLYDHSGISMRVGRKSDNPWDSQGWDTSDVGFIYATREDIEKEGFTLEQAEDCLRAEVATYDRYLRGEAYGFVIYEFGNAIDSCWGFDDFELCKQEAVQALQDYKDSLPVEDENGRITKSFTEALAELCGSRWQISSISQSGNLLDGTGYVFEVAAKDGSIFNIEVAGPPDNDDIAKGKA